VKELPAFLSFAGGKYAWRATGRRVLRQAAASQYFSSAKLLRPEDPERARMYGELNSSTRGYGYWRWKPQIVYQQLQSLPKSVPGLWYLDAGCTIFSSAAARVRMRQYLDFGLQTGVGTFFQLPSNYSDLAFTKEMTHSAIPISAELQATGQIQATAFFLANTDDGLSLARRWADLSEREELFDDSCNFRTLACPENLFVAHRHDQSVLSLLVKSREIPVLSDELNQDRATTLHQVSGQGVEVPILATRHKSYFSSLSMHPAARAVRAIEGAMP
jgi:hypothetical protein